MNKLLSLSKARSIIRSFPRARVLVVGDLIMDHFIWGDVSRISPEAPVPVVRVSGETIVLGGAANVTANIMSLGGSSSVSGVVGSDTDGRKLKRMLLSLKATSSGVTVDSKRPTTIKTRIIAHSQQVVRFDREKHDPLTPAIKKKVYGYIKKAAKEADVIVVSDYSKGLVTRELMEVVLGAAASATPATKKGRALPVFVDPKVGHFDRYTGATCVTPNNNEASLATSMEIRDKASLKKAARDMLKTLECEAVLITRGEHGMSLFSGGRETHIPTVAREVYDVSGAGDTVIAVMALAYGAGATMKEAAVLSNLAAGVVVGKVGTATVTKDELLKTVKERLG